MNIGVVTTSYPRWPGDAAGNFVGAHVAAMRALGHTVDVIAAGPPSDDATRIPSDLFYTGGAPDRLEQGWSMLTAASFAARLTAAVVKRSRDWDLAIAHWLVPSAIAALASRKPVLAIAHGGDIHTLARTHLLRPVLVALRNAEIVYVSNALRADRPGLVQPMGIDVAHFSSIPRRPTNNLLVLARLVPIKGIDIAIAAMDHLPDYTLTIAGDGPLRFPPHPRVRFVGAVDAPERDRLLSEAHTLLVPSRTLPNGRSEGTPLVALEALAAGVPVIACRTGGLVDLPIALVPPEDPIALARAVGTVQPRVDMRNFDWPVVANRLLAYAAGRRTA